MTIDFIILVAFRKETINKIMISGGSRIFDLTERY